jgi:hypothetical protein
MQRGETNMRNVVLILVGLIATASADMASAASYKFQLHNDSEYEVTGFQTYEDGEWSTWSNVHAAPGETQTMDWNTDKGDCVVPFRIIYKDVETEQYKVNWCEISHIRIHDDKVTAD